MKLYVIVRNSLTPSQKAVQAGHAVAAYMQRHDDWQNETLVYLDANPVDFDFCQYLVTPDRMSEFREPDLDDLTTAFATTEFHRYFNRLSLL